MAAEAPAHTVPVHAPLIASDVEQSVPWAPPLPGVLPQPSGSRVVVARVSASCLDILIPAAGWRGATWAFSPLIMVGVWLVFWNTMVALMLQSDEVPRVLTILVVITELGVSLSALLLVHRACVRALRQERFCIQEEEYWLVQDLNIWALLGRLLWPPVSHLGLVGRLAGARVRRQPNPNGLVDAPEWVEFVEGSRRFGFGHGLPRAELDWLASEINGVLAARRGAIPTASDVHAGIVRSFRKV